MNKEKQMELLIEISTKQDIVLKHLEKLNGSVAKNTSFRTKGTVYFKMITFITCGIIVPVFIKVLYDILSTNS